jgi:tellurite resistance protein TerC
VPTLGTPSHWTVFTVLLAGVLIVDLILFGRRKTAIPLRHAAAWTAFCVSLAFGFAGWLAWGHGSQPALEFVAGYLIEYALSVDNLFVFLVIFTYFSVPPAFQRRALFWGILGAICLRGLFILAGTALIQNFRWSIYLFGAFLVYTGFKLLFVGDEMVSLDSNRAVKLARRFLPVAPDYHEERFFVRLDGRLMATPLLLVLVVIELTDVVFAVDSIPAVFGITQDPYLVFTSNMFAILGLRALYFLLSDFMGRFHYLKFGLGLVLAFVGLKMVVSGWYHVPIGISLGVIVLLLGGSVALSLLRPPAAPAAPGEGAGPAQESAAKSASESSNR